MTSLFRSMRNALRTGSQRPRRHPRVMISEPVRLRKGWSAEQPGILEDISAGGACIRTHVRLRPGDTVGLLVSLGGMHRFDACARVVYANATPASYQTRYGMRFVAISERDAEHISDFVVEQKFGRQFGVRPCGWSFERELL